MATTCLEINKEVYMKVYLVWERESYCEYNVVKIFTTRDKSDEWLIHDAKTDEYDYWIEEREVDMK
jgi:hypothetical protein